MVWACAERYSGYTGQRMLNMELQVKKDMHVPTDNPLHVGRK